jgi:membrane protease YdiL (CAAX protease family)
MVKTLSFIAAVYLLTYIILRWRGKRGVSLAPLSIGVLGILYQVIINRYEPVTAVGLNFATPGDYLLGALSVCLVLAIGAGLGFATGKLAIQKEETKRSPWKIVWTVLVLFIQTAFIAIFTEELVFRGLIQRELAGIISPTAAIIIASASFGVWHILVAPYIGVKG